MLAGIGSSPLARGLLPAHVLRHAYHRIIPARAGFTRSIADLVSVARDHPRSRGVYITSPSRSSSAEGSSPLARGLQSSTCAWAAALRIIPARAGFTFISGSFRLVLPDHPRSRGVYPESFQPSVNGRGSSPLARGLQFPYSRPTLTRGIIPARAGFTAARLTATTVPPDHPRSRGVYVDRITGDAVRAGSSPLARGLPRANLCAVSHVSDHPRSRGVYIRLDYPSPTEYGSSPLARGLP